VSERAPTDLDRGDLVSVLVHGPFALSPARSAVDRTADEAGDRGFVHSFHISHRDDGPGLRFALFTTGCYLRCQYCHNPDTWHLHHGTEVSVDRVRRELAKYVRPLADVHGGFTVSGGEPLVQPAFVHRLLRMAKEEFGLHTALDTSGFLGARVDDAWLEAVDLVLLDLKSWDPATYRRVTGADLEPTLRFAERLAALEKPVWVRFVLVPGLTDDAANVEGLAAYCASLGNVEQVDVLPFHQLGRYKYAELGIAYPLQDEAPPSRDLLRRVRLQFEARGLPVG
jgi:pyruvate formate lyase activating enzyme